LLFSVDSYEAAAQAYIDGINDRIKAGLAVDKIASVASVFVSRIDTAVDKLLNAAIAAGKPDLNALIGKTGIANSKLIYQRYLSLFEGSGFAGPRAKGAHVQRPLWASTGTKNPAFSDLMYVEGLVAKDTVNTVPPQTLDALLDHGKVRADAILADLNDAHATLDALVEASISLPGVTDQLVVEGVKSFADSFEQMLAAIAKKHQALSAAAPAVATR
jgi:transaldolase